MCGMLRCCVPTCTMRLCSFCAAMTALPSSRSCVSGFSTYTSLPALQASIVIGTCQWSGVPIRTASTSLRASSSSCCLVANAFGSASFLAASRLCVPDVADGGDRDVGDLRERLHQVAAAAADADEPTWSVSLAANPRADSTASPAAREEARKVRRSVVVIGRLRWREMAPRIIRRGKRAGKKKNPRGFCPRGPDEGEPSVMRR